MNKASAAFLRKTFLFKGLNDTKFCQIAEKYESVQKIFSKGDLIFSPTDFESKIGFVVRGECVVSKKHSDGGYIPINSILPGASFGIMSVFSKQTEYPTYVFAKKTTTILFIDGNTLQSIIKAYPSVAINVITFLTDRIAFLNDKISTFSGNTVEEKLANYILSQYKRIGSLEFDFNKLQSAEAISAGRASLYRALEKFKDTNLITYDNKKIYILDLEGLERIIK